MPPENQADRAQPTVISTPAATLPAMIDALPPDSHFSGQLRFARKRQAAFLKLLADCGEVRAAARAAAVSHQTVYRMRRASQAFRAGMDAAQLIARELAEDLLATRAMHGVEEEVFYHGEAVATRHRFSDRLLLAHLARLDRKAEREDAASLTETFDALVDALENAVDESEEGLAEFVSGQCNMRSTSFEDDAADCEESDSDVSAANGADHALESRLCAMEAARPEGAPSLEEQAEITDEIGELEAIQLTAFEAGEANWWLFTKRAGEGTHEPRFCGDSAPESILTSPERERDYDTKGDGLPGRFERGSDERVVDDCSGAGSGW